MFFGLWREASAGGVEIASGSRLLGAKRQIELSAHCRNYVTFYMLATITIKRPATEDYHVALGGKKSLRSPSAAQYRKLRIMHYMRHACIFWWNSALLCGRKKYPSESVAVKVWREWCASCWLKWCCCCCDTMVTLSAFNYFPRLFGRDQRALAVCAKFQCERLVMRKRHILCLSGDWLWLTFWV